MPCLKTVKKINKMLNRLGLLHAAQRKPRLKDVRKAMKVLATARESIWELEEMFTEVQTQLNMCSMAMEKRQNEQTLVSGCGRCAQ